MCQHKQQSAISVRLSVCLHALEYGEMQQKWTTEWTGEKGLEWSKDQCCRAEIKWSGVRWAEPF